MTTIRIATRGDPLALARAGWVSARLGTLDHRSELVIVEAFAGLDPGPVAETAGRGGAIEAVRAALLEGRADMAVHAFDELPAAPFPGLEIAAVPERTDPRDVLLIRPAAFATDAGALPLRLGVRVDANSSLRRSQLLHLRPDLDAHASSGDVPTRIEHLRIGEMDALLLAAADLEPLGLSAVELATSDLEVVPLAVETWVPAPAQGALALEIRRDDAPLAQLLTDLHAPRDYRAVAAERGLLAMLGAEGSGLGAHASAHHGLVTLVAWYRAQRVQLDHPSSEGAAMLAFEALGRPDGSDVGGGRKGLGA